MPMPSCLVPAALLRELRWWWTPKVVCIAPRITADRVAEQTPADV